MCTFHAYQPHSFSPHYWLSRVLGHKGLNESAHYANVQISADFGATAQRLTKLLDAGVSPSVAPKHATDETATNRALAGATAPGATGSAPALQWADARQAIEDNNDDNVSTASEDLDTLAASLD